MKQTSNFNDSSKKKRVLGRGQEGMTLIEIMIVVIIMASIATGVAVGVTKVYLDAQKDQAKIDVSALKSAAKLSRLNFLGECPTVEFLITEGYLDGDARKLDPWGSDFIVYCTETDIEIFSAGPDKTVGTEDDIR